MKSYLKKHSHGTHNVLPQLVKSLISSIYFGSGISCYTSHEDSIRGRIHKKLCTEFLQALDRENYTSSSSTFPVFLYKLDGVLYQTWKKTGQLRNSSICKFSAANGTSAFGSIHCFCLYNKVPVAIKCVHIPIESKPFDFIIPLPIFL